MKLLQVGRRSERYSDRLRFAQCVDGSGLASIDFLHRSQLAIAYGYGAERGHVLTSMVLRSTLEAPCAKRPFS
jgi:hypothetical protein